MNRNHLSASKLIAKIRRSGGDIRIGHEGQIQFKNCSPRLKELVRRERYCVLAFLREERATKAWEASGRDPNWWRAYCPTYAIPVASACTCSEFSFPHVHKDTGPAPNWRREGDVFEEIKNLMKQSKKEKVH